MLRMIKKVFHFFYVLYAFLMFFILMLFVAFFVFIFIFFPNPQSGNYIYRVCYWWASIWFALIGIKHEVIYEDGDQYTTPTIFVANHQSYMDIPATVQSLKTPYRILAKSEMAKIPIFGFIYKKAAIMVDRSDRAKRGESYLILKKSIAHGLSVLIYPEGTFNETGNPLKDFYDGAFKLAINTQTDIQPMVLINTLDRLHYNSVFSLSPGKCQTVFLPKISVAGYDKKDVEKLKAIVFDTMEEAIVRYSNKNFQNTYK